VIFSAAAAAHLIFPPTLVGFVLVEVARERGRQKE